MATKSRTEAPQYNSKLPSRYYRAMQIRAAKKNRTVPDIHFEVLEEALRLELEEIDRNDQEEQLSVVNKKFA